MTARRSLLALITLLGTLLLLPGHAAAHPLGNFTVNQFVRVEPYTDYVALRYVVDMAEIPALQELQRIDTDRSGDANDAERDAYIVQQIATLTPGLALQVDGRSVTLEPIAHELSFPRGQGGLLTLRLVIDYRAPLALTADTRIDFALNNYEERQGWRELIARPGAGATLTQSSVPAQDTSDELRVYPEDLLTAPVDTRTLVVVAAPGVGQAAVPARGAIADQRTSDRFAELVAAPDLTPTFVLSALGLAFVLGAGHALAPGHGKTVVAAYLVGSRGTALHALMLGVITTITHTAGVFALGGVTLLLSQYILPEQLYPVLQLVSGLLVIAIGVALFRARLRAARAPAGAHAHGGFGVHTHGPGGHTHEEDEALADWATARARGDRTKQRVSWRSLLALGVSGGLLPCPSALVVMLSAIALGRVGFGLILILVFSTGLATVLTLIGIALVKARDLFDRLPMQRTWLRVLPVISAGVVTLAGVVITVGALAQSGLLRF